MYKTKTENISSIAQKVSIMTIIGNVVLTAFKLIAGFIGNSNAMISDAIHSASDVFSTIIVIIGIRLSLKQSDKEHPYGHERFECVAAIILSVILFATGLKVGFRAINSLLSNSSQTTEPGLIALVAAFVSILAKELMFWYTKINAKRIDSAALMADAWHHRSDAFSSIGAMVGIIGTKIGYPFMDSVASLIIFAFIIKASFDIFIDAAQKVVDNSCGEEIETNIKKCATKNPEVKGVDELSTRKFGNMIYVDIEIRVSGDYTLRKAHDIAQEVHDSIEDSFPKTKHVMVHVNPDD